jgi:hypothetical protein
MIEISLKHSHKATPFLVRSQDLTVALMKIQVFWAVMCRMVNDTSQPEDLKLR